MGHAVKRSGTERNIDGILRLITRLATQDGRNWFIITVSALLEQPCNKSDSPIKLVTSCCQFVAKNLEQAVWQQFVNRIVKTCCEALFGP